MQIDPEYADTIESLKKAYVDDHALREVLNTFLKYKIGRTQVAVDRTWKLVEDKTLKRSKVIATMKRLEEDFEVGEFIKGAHGYASRFTFASDLSALKVALWASGATEDDIPETSEDLGGEDDLVGHTFRLRPDLQIVLRLPEDITYAEAKRLSAWLKCIPMDSDGEVY